MTTSISSRARLAARLLLPLVVVGLGAASSAGCPALAPAHSAPQESPRRAPQELFEVLKIVDGDTLHIARGGETEKLRLLSVDTEEKFTPGMQSSPTKPQTVFGEETRLWTIDFLEQYRAEDGKLRVGLAFPGGEEAYDVYGRLLCHVILPDGDDFNLLLVELGKSPYFNKYGNSRVAHDAFVAAQARARRRLLGIWNPRTNRSADGRTPSAVRPYARLLPWWQARAEAIDGFRRAAARAPREVLAADDPAALQAALEGGQPVEVFGTPDRFFEEQDGSRTVLFRTSDRRRALRVAIPAAARASFEALDLDGLGEEFRQNYAYVRGVVTRGERGYRIETPSVDAWRRAGPEPQEAGDSD